MITCTKFRTCDATDVQTREAVHTHTHTLACTCKCTYTYTCTCTCAHAHTKAHAHMYTCVHQYTHIRTHSDECISSECHPTDYGDQRMYVCVEGGGVFVCVLIACVSNPASLLLQHIRIHTHASVTDPGPLVLSPNPAPLLLVPTHKWPRSSSSDMRRSGTIIGMWVCCFKPCRPVFF